MDLPLLYELQDLHKEMDVIAEKLKELSETNDLKKLKGEYQRLSKEYQQGEESLKKNAYQQEIRNNEIKNLEYNKKACEEIKFSKETDTVKKLESIEKQLEQLEEKKQVVENVIITLIDEVDNTNKNLAETKKRSVFIKKKYASSKENIVKSIEELEARKSKLSTEIDSMIKKVSKDNLEMYNRLLKSYGDPVARIVGRSCSGCKMEVSAMDYEALKSGSQELRCQSCGRLLYFHRA
jgi:uncharacterized protein